MNFDKLEIEKIKRILLYKYKILSLKYECIYYE